MTPNQKACYPLIWQFGAELYINESLKTRWREKEKKIKDWEKLDEDEREKKRQPARMKVGKTMRLWEERFRLLVRGGMSEEKAEREASFIPPMDISLVKLRPKKSQELKLLDENEGIDTTQGEMTRVILDENDIDTLVEKVKKLSLGL